VVTGTTGTYYIDEIEATYNANLIGPVSPFKQFLPMVSK
jgi:hypothetical protein